MTLNQLSQNVAATIVSCADLQLREIGFSTGEKVKIIAVASFDGPLAVRVGTSTFALRIEEAELIEVI